VLGIHALGIFPGRVTLNEKRWFPLGPKGEALQAVEFCPRNAKCDLSFGADRASARLRSRRKWSMSA
jgi:hypothetical protein